MPYKDPEIARAHRAARYQARKDEYLTKMRAHYAVHKKRILDRNKRYYEAHKAEISLQQKIYNAAHAEHIQARHKAYRQRTIDKQRAYFRAYAPVRRARKAQAPLNDLTLAQWQEIKAAYGHRCVYCGRKMQRLTQDHLHPLSKGGSHTASNVVPACKSCNSKKHTGPPLVPVQPLMLTIATSKKHRR